MTGTWCECKVMHTGRIFVMSPGSMPIFNAVHCTNTTKPHKFSKLKSDGRNRAVSSFNCKIVKSCESDEIEPRPKKKVSPRTKKIPHPMVRRHLIMVCASSPLKWEEKIKMSANAYCSTCVPYMFYINCVFEISFSRVNCKNDVYLNMLTRINYQIVSLT